MERKEFSYIVSHMWAAVALVTAALSTATVLAQTPPSDGHHGFAAEPGPPHARTTMDGRTAMLAGQKMMMADQSTMMAEMVAADQKLADLVARMNAAQGDEKVSAMAAVITELAEQRARMQKQMMRMQSQMMDHMKAHMSGMHGAGVMEKKTPADPLPAPPPAGDADHSAHHPEK